jgi:4'-phosphopantetheinyl transferase
MNPVICIVKNEKPIDETTFHFLLQFAPPEKQARIFRQRIKQNRDNMLIGAALAKYMIWNEFNIIPSEQQIAYGPFGKPYLADYPNVHFNISHCKAGCVVAVCDIAVGVDIQEVRPFSWEVSRQVCSNQEMDMIRNSLDKDRVFTRIWSMKESYVKMLGQGVSYGMDKVDTVSSIINTTVFEREDSFVSICCNQNK